MSFPRATLRTHRIIRTVASLVIIASVFAAWRFVNFSAIFDFINAHGYDPSKELSALIARLRLTPTGDRIMRGTRAELQQADDFNASCESHNDSTILLGCYANNHIYIYNIDDRDLKGVREATLAHELLHAIWGRMTEEGREAIRPSLRKVYDENEDLQAHLKLYDNTEFYDELHSIVGSQIPNDQLPEDLRAHFAKYFTNQNLIANYYHQYSDQLAVIEKRLKELEILIEKGRAEIEKRNREYTLANNRLSKDAEVHNARDMESATREEREEYNREAEELRKRQEELSREYSALQTLLVEYNAYIVEYNQFVIFTQKVYDSMNSRVEKPATN